MAHIDLSNRWAIGAWCALAIALAGSGVGVGARPSWTAMLLMVCTAPLAAVATLAGLRPEPRTAAQIRHEQDRAAR